MLMQAAWLVAACGEKEDLGESHQGKLIWGNFNSAKQVLGLSWEFRALTASRFLEISSME